MRPHVSDFSGATIGGRYELRSLLGTGGFGSVYEARDTRLDRRVAVKLIHQWWAQDPDWSTRFEREARLAASVGHPGIVVVHDTGRDDDLGLYIVYELIDGESLAARMARERISPQLAAALCADVLDALQAAHSRGIVHRDVGPQNVLLGADGAVKITDFGVAYLATGVTRSSAPATIVGKPVYMSPEQSRGRQVGPASDIYAVGVLLYELLAGKPPFDGENYVEIAMKHNSDDVPPLPTDVPRELASVTLRALAKEPERRFPSASAMAAGLRTALQGDRPTERLASHARARIRPKATNGSEALTASLPRRATGRRRSLVGAGVLAICVGAGAAVLLLEHRGTTRSASHHTGAAGSSTVKRHKRRKVVFVKVPRLIGLSQNAALNRGRADKFDIATISAPSSTTPAGSIIDQQPRPGTLARPSSTVNVRVSTGPPPTTVPDLVRASLATAESQLAQVSLRPDVVMVPGSGATAGTVVSQHPTAGAAVTPGSSVTLDVARTPSWQTVTTLDLTSDGSSPLFRITASQWRVRYDLMFGQCLGQCFGPSLYVTGADGSFEYYQLGSGTHQTDIPTPPGRYSLKVSGSQDPFSLHLVVEQYS